MRIGGEVAVDNPNETAFRSDDQVRIPIPVDEIGQSLEPVVNIAMDQHPAVTGEVAGEQDVAVAVMERGHQAHPQRTGGDPTLALVVRMNIVGSGRIVELLLGGVYKDRFVSDLAEVQFRASDLQRGGLHVHRRVLHVQ